MSEREQEQNATFRQEVAVNIREVRSSLEDAALLVKEMTRESKNSRAILLDALRVAYRGTNRILRNTPLPTDEEVCEEAARRGFVSNLPEGLWLGRRFCEGLLKDGKVRPELLARKKKECYVRNHTIYSSSQVYVMRSKELDKVFSASFTYNNRPVKK